MKYNIHVNQVGADLAGLRGVVDIIDLAIFDAFKDFANSGRCEKMSADDKIWFWIDYNLIIEELPYCNITTKDAVYRRMIKLCKAEIIEFYPGNQKLGRSFFCWGINYDALITTTAPTDKKPDPLRMKNRRGMDEKSEGSGSKTAPPSDEKPDNYNTNNPTTKHTTKSDIPGATAPVEQDDFIEFEEVKEEEIKEGALKAAPAPTGWTKKWATAFDQVNQEKHEANKLEYTAFNWVVCEKQNFGHLKNLREKCIIPGLCAKRKTAGLPDPGEADFLSSARQLFELSWDYFYRLQEAKGGGLEYKPSSIYSNFNSIKSFKNGTAANSAAGKQIAKSPFNRGIDDNGKFDQAKGY